MTHWDVFNGDADGLCSLQQWRLAHPATSTVVTGVKRDIALLQRVPARAGDRVVVFDIAVRANARPLARLLAHEVDVEWFDHHDPGPVPQHPRLTAHLDRASDVCTGVIVDRVLNGRHRRWAIAAAFGDNLHATALALGRTLDLHEAGLDGLRRVGEAFTYNAYADHPDELIVHPADLFARLAGCEDPLAFAADDPIVATLDAARVDDLERAWRTPPEHASAGAAVFVLPDEPWSRRVRGAFAHGLARRDPERAHAVLSPSGGGFDVSVRAPIARPSGADRFCSTFARGGGRAGAAGIDGLPAHDLATFVAAFVAAFAQGIAAPG